MVNYCVTHLTMEDFVLMKGFSVLYYSLNSLTPGPAQRRGNDCGKPPFSLVKMNHHINL